MCGILGAIGDFDKPSIIDAAKELHHRGPDFTGFLNYDSKLNYFQDNEQEFKESKGIMSFAHTRLSIIDLHNHSNQPFIKHGKAMVFNGEIYNYIELRKELESMGYEFETSSDTEVLLSSFDAWGEDCQSRLNGMWAFAIFDPEKDSIFFSRDRFGIKPLYYSQTEKGLAFSSEIKSLLKIESIIKKPNLEQLRHYLFWGAQEVESPTMFETIFKLLPGHSMSYNISSRELKSTEWYNIKNVPERINPNLEDSVNSIAQSFKDSIKFRMRADVPVAVSLSGGLDSSSILMESSQVAKENQNTFSIIYGEKYQDIDESKWVDIMNERIGSTNFKEIPTYESLRDNLEDFIYTYDEPIRGTTFFAQWSLMKLINKNKIRVSLEGQGGDEVFGGYLYTMMINGFLSNLINNHLNVSPVQLLKNLFYIYFPGLYEKLIIKKVSKVLNYKGSVPRNYNKPFRHKKTVNGLIKHELSSGMRILLKKVDRASMNFSIESRVPYLDHNFVESTFQANPAFKSFKGWTRYIQRKVFDKRLPDEIVWRKSKLGFPTPHSDWMNALRKEKKVIETIEGSKLLNDLGIDKDVSDPAYYWKVLNIAYWEKLFWK